MKPQAERRKPTSVWEFRQSPTAQLLDKPAAPETIALLWGWQLVAAYHLNLQSSRFFQYAPDQNDVDPDTSNRLHEILSSLPGLGLKQMKA